MCRWQLGLELKQSYSPTDSNWNVGIKCGHQFLQYKFDGFPNSSILFMKYSYTFILAEKSKIHFGSSLESTKLELVCKQKANANRKTFL